MTVDPVYTPTPISQRDGSALANSNCRCASIATGLDYQERGGKKSTGSKMRSYMDDQSGGTDAGDAAQAWQRGYSETLTVRDGYTFDNALQDLGKGSAVHLDVWHAAAGGPCLSGSGAYGHTMFVLPDQHSDGTKWRTSDPWCSPGRWDWWPESKLRAGAEEWGRRVYGAARAEDDWPTGGGDPRSELRLFILRRIVKRFMTRWHPGAPADEPWPYPIDPETGGGQPILFTRTAALGVATAEEPDMPGLRVHYTDGNWLGQVTINSDGASAIQLADADMIGLARGQVREAYGKVELGETFTTPGGTSFPAGTDGFLIGTEPAFVFASNVDAVEAAPPPDTDTEADLEERDQEWRDWLLDGSPGSE